MKFTKVFHGVPNGGIYPVEYQPGEVCPPELAFAAAEADALEEDRPHQEPLSAAAAPVVDAPAVPAAEPVAAVAASPLVEQVAAVAPPTTRKKKK